MRFRKPELSQLMSDHERLREEAKALLQAFNRLPPDQVTARLAVGKEMVAKYVSSNQVMLDLLERFSPTAAKELRYKLKNHERLWEDWLTNLPDPKTPGREAIISDRMTELLNSIDLYQQIAGIAFVAAAETVKRTKGTPPEQLDEYVANRLHNDVKNASSKLFHDGHYAQSILEAYKALNNSVKIRSGLTNLDGKPLMSRAFAPDNPVLTLNKLETTSDKDEQEGFMFLYMGAMVGIRNPKAHEINEQEDVQTAVEYLVLASLLAKRLEGATKVAAK